MEILQAKEDLLRNHLDKCNRNSRLIVPLNEGKQVFPEGFEYDADVDVFWRAMLEGV